MFSFTMQIVSRHYRTIGQHENVTLIAKDSDHAYKMLREKYPIASYDIYTISAVEITEKETRDKHFETMMNKIICFDCG